MTNLNLIEFIDEFLREQEDVLHGIEGRDCTKSRKYLDMIKKQLSIHGVSKRLSIKLEDWHYQCGDGCCDMYGTEIALNGKVCDNQYAGDDVQKSLEFVLSELGYEVDIDVC